jgi:hypothetical protein
LQPLSNEGPLLLDNKINLCGWLLRSSSFFLVNCMQGIVSNTTAGGGGRFWSEETRQIAVFEKWLVVLYHSRGLAAGFGVNQGIS